MTSPKTPFNQAAVGALPPKIVEAFLNSAATGSNETLTDYLDNFGDALCLARDDTGRTALIRAAEAGRQGAVDLLLKRGAAIDAADANGTTALMLAARRGYKSMAAFLLDRGAGIDAANHKGQTPLMLAATHKDNRDGKSPMSHKKRETVLLLLQRGARPEAQDNEGYTAETWARCHGYGYAARVIAEEGAARAAKRAADVGVFTAGLPEDITVRGRFRFRAPGQ